VINAVADWSEDSSEVLLIAGDTDVAEMYRMKLELDGYRVSTVADVSDSTAHAAGWKPDMVLIDLGAGNGAHLAIFSAYAQILCCRVSRYCSCPAAPKKNCGSRGLRSDRPTTCSGPSSGR
jgi:hypothetical protein